MKARKKADESKQIDKFAPFQYNNNYSFIG